jgi:hypothetical protein
MLPGYTPQTFTVENHIHLGYSARDGSSPTGMGDHGEPPYRFRHAGKRTPHFEGSMAFERSWDGAPHDHVLLAIGSVAPIIFVDVQYQLRCSLTEMDLLKKLLYHRVLLIDHLHCPDNSDHSPYIKKYFFADLSYEENLDPMLQYNNVQVTFKDMNTVAGIND